MNGFPDGPELRTGPAVMDMSKGMMATIAVLGALAARERSGKGQRVEVCLFDVATLMLGFHAIADPDEQLNPDPTEIADARWFTRAEIRAVATGNPDAWFGIAMPSSIAHNLIMKWLNDE